MVMYHSHVKLLEDIDTVCILFQDAISKGCMACPAAGVNILYHDVLVQASQES